MLFLVILCIKTSIRARLVNFEVLKKDSQSRTTRYNIPYQEHSLLVLDVFDGIDLPSFNFRIHSINNFLSLNWRIPKFSKNSHAKIGIGTHDKCGML